MVMRDSVAKELGGLEEVAFSLSRQAKAALDALAEAKSEWADFQAGEDDRLEAALDSVAEALYAFSFLSRFGSEATERSSGLHDDLLVKFDDLMLN